MKLTIGKRQVLCAVIFWTAVFWTAVFLPAWGETEKTVRLWPVDIHEKIFPESEPIETAELLLYAARNEYESGQFGVRSETAGEFTLSVSDLTGSGGETISASAVRLRPIRSIPIEHNTPEIGDLAVRKAPAQIPEILMEENTVSVEAGQSAGVWVTVQIPKEAASGDYTGTITLTGENASAELPLRLHVFNFTLSGDRHLWVTNGIDLAGIAKYHKVEKFSEEFWPVLEKYFRNMAEHRQNIVFVPWVPKMGLVKATRKADGSFTFDFSLLDQYLKIAEECGLAGRYKLISCGGIYRPKHSISYRTAFVFDEQEGKEVELQADEWLEPVLKGLNDWLDETGRLDRTMIQVTDEPFMADIPAWRELSRRIHQIAPKMKRIDAVEATGFTDDLDIWVPKLSHYDQWKKVYNRLRSDRNEFWYYICCHPFGTLYPNRFIDLPATRIRSLHWINYTEQLTGYLHWGYNFWLTDDPFGAPLTKHGPGDSHAVYPGPLDSIRWEIERESIEDYEYFVLLESLLAEIKAQGGEKYWWLEPNFRSMELAHRAVHEITDIELDPAVFQKTRLELAQEIERLTSGLKLVVCTFPEDGAVLTTGPILVEVRGITEPGAVVKINGKEIPLTEDGSFEYGILREKAEKCKKVTVTAEKDGQTVSAERTFICR